jgi:hypothetical protein
MVGGDAEPDEAPGRGQPLEEVDLRRRVGGEQSSSRVEAGRARADDRDAEWVLAQWLQPEPQP